MLAIASPKSSIIHNEVGGILMHYVILALIMSSYNSLLTPSTIMFLDLLVVLKPYLKGQKSEQTVHQRRCTYGWSAQEKRLNIISPGKCKLRP